MELYVISYGWPSTKQFLKHFEFPPQCLIQSNVYVRYMNWKRFDLVRERNRSRLQFLSWCVVIIDIMAMFMSIATVFTILRGLVSIAISDSVYVLAIFWMTGARLSQHVIPIALAWATEVFLLGMLWGVYIVVAWRGFAMSSSMSFVGSILLMVCLLMFTIFGDLTFALIAKGLVHQISDLEELNKVLQQHLVVPCCCWPIMLQRSTDNALKERRVFSLPQLSVHDQP